MSQTFSLRTTCLTILTVQLLLTTPSLSWAINKVSLKSYPQLSITVPNPMETSKLPPRKTLQVNHEDFVLQFFFNERDIFGYILKRDKKHPIHFRWCFSGLAKKALMILKRSSRNRFHPRSLLVFFQSVFLPTYTIVFKG